MFQLCDNHHVGVASDKIIVPINHMIDIHDDNNHDIADFVAEKGGMWFVNIC